MSATRRTIVVSCRQRIRFSFPHRVRPRSARRDGDPPSQSRPHRHRRRGPKRMLVAAWKRVTCALRRDSAHSMPRGFVLMSPTPTPASTPTASEYGSTLAPSFVTDWSFL
ncbi:hypothetical protein OF83DRAFT_1178682 [Amylostereum chailletii]|nr:hypothetical protein OF83DRAFT_1178682 [Amylostereum chailletii]